MTSQVPNVVFGMVADAVNEYAEAFPLQYQEMREFLTKRVQAHRVAGNIGGFSLEYRHEATPAHALIYSLVSTVAANIDTAANLERFFDAGRVIA